MDTLSGALAELPFEQREILMLHLHGQRSFRAIAQARQISMNTAKSRYRYGLDKLRSILDDKVSFRQLRKHERSEYDPQSRTITLSYEQEDDFAPQTSSPALIVDSMQKMLKDHGAQIVTRMGEYQGRKVQVQEISLANHFRGIALYTTKLYVDPQSKLLCAMEVRAVDANDVPVSAAQATYDYPQTGPRDIYDLGVPRDARVVNKMPAHDLRGVLERYRQIREDATKEYIAVIAHNTAMNITEAINMVDVDYKSRRQHRWERHSVFD